MIVVKRCRVMSVTVVGVGGFLIRDGDTACRIGVRGNKNIKLRINYLTS